jgi:hypothetical protein
MSKFLHCPCSAPRWGLTLFALLFWGAFNQLQHRAWFAISCHSEARPNGEFEDRAPDAKPLPAVYLDNDSLYWLHNATELLEGGSWRPHHTDWDNVPWGRPNHWSSPLIWAMAGTTRVASLFTNRPAVELLPVVSPWINPVLFALFLGATAILLGRRFSPWIAGLLVLSLATLPPIMRSFTVLHIDHHGLVDIPALWMSLFLLFGVVGRSESRDVAAIASKQTHRGWFLAAGILGGVGLWLQASHQLILIAGTLSSLLLWSLFSRPPLSISKGARTDDLLNPGPWRAWAGAGALVSLVAYALEYAPAHLGMQLEVNHPLYALSWWGGTEAVLAIARSRRQRKWTPLRLAIIAGGVLPVVITILLMRYGPEQWFAVSSPFLQRIHEQIREFQPLLSTLRGVNPLLLFLLFNSLPLIALLGMGLWGSRTLPARERMGLHLALFTLLPALVLCLRHARYSSLLAATLWGMAVAVFLALSHPPLGRKWHRLPPALLASGCAMSLLFTLSPLFNARLPFMPVDRWVPQMLHRDIARELATLPDFPKSRVLCSYTIAPNLQAFSGAQTTGGLYWENIEGLRAATEFFSATNEAEARRILQERDIRWIVLEAKPGAEKTWIYYQYGNTRQSSIRETMAFRLTAPGRAPDWLERIPHGKLPLATKASFQIYRVK